MRKVLLATTALVAMSVTAAQADVSISGNQTFEVTDTGAATTFYQDGAVTIKSVNTTVRVLKPKSNSSPSSPSSKYLRSSVNQFWWVYPSFE